MDGICGAHGRNITFYTYMKLYEKAGFGELGRIIFLGEMGHESVNYILNISLQSSMKIRSNDSHKPSGSLTV
jgi:hypothetical protein